MAQICQDGGTFEHDESILTFIPLRIIDIAIPQHRSGCRSMSGKDPEIVTQRSIFGVRTARCDELRFKSHSLEQECPRH